MDQPDMNMGTGTGSSPRAAARRDWRAAIRDAVRWRRGAVVVAALALLALYGPVIAGLVRAWHTNPDYAHGFLIAPLCVYLVWQRRRRLADLEVRPSAAGLVLVVVSLALFVVGQLGAEQFLSRVSLVGVLAGSVAFVLGLAHVRVLAFTFALAVLTIPLPAIVFNEIAQPLQLLASSVAEQTLLGLGIPALREGNVILLSTATLEVAEACSGIRSMVSLLAAGMVYGYFTDDRTVRRVLLALSTLPIAVAANALRVAGTGVLAHVAGAAAADGFFHTFAGWLVFMSALAMMFLVHAMLRLASQDAEVLPMVGEAVR
jgi:exosortase